MESYQGKRKFAKCLEFSWIRGNWTVTHFGILLDQHPFPRIGHGLRPKWYRMTSRCTLHKRNTIDIMLSTESATIATPSWRQLPVFPMIVINHKRISLKRLISVRVNRITNYESWNNYVNRIADWAISDLWLKDSNHESLSFFKSFSIFTS